ncbi:hypothetical protein BDR06DRAFT_1005310 [Suillus hirtellus]|nr:hypothetical protein BDR06DRAFT_1005310 [Suillus hirtellus]
MLLSLDLGGSTRDGTTTPAVDAEIIPVQLATQDLSNSTANGSLIPPALILAQPTALDLLLATCPVDTPIKQNSSMVLPFTTFSQCRVDTLNSMGKEMQDFIVGPMPVKNFLNKFLPNPEDHHTLDFTSHFALASNAAVFNMQSIKKEEDSYRPFVSDLAPMPSRFLTV